MSGSPSSASSPQPASNSPGTASTGQAESQQQPQPTRPTTVSPQILAQLAAAGAIRPLPFGLIPGSPIPIFVPTVGGAAAQAQQTIQLWQGQYPPPDAIEHYERVLPGSFNRMIQMAEKLQGAQIEEAKRAHEYAHSDARRGHWLGFAAAVLAMAAALGALAFGYPWVSAAFISVPVMGVAKALVEATKTSSPSQMLAAVTGQGGSIAPIEPPTPSDSSSAPT